LNGQTREAGPDHHGKQLKKRKRERGSHSGFSGKNPGTG
jgi:hypothetical protein